MISNEQKAYVYLTSLFCSALVIASVLASKIISIGKFSAPAGIIAYSLTYLSTDIIGEIYGPDAAKSTIRAGFISLVFTTVLVQLSLILPGATFWENDEAYRSVFSNSWRIVLASLTAYIVSQSTDHFIFHRLRERTRGRHLWLRNNISTISAQIVDSLIFILIGFGYSPIYFQLVFGQIMLKSLIAILDTPLVYAGKALLTKRSTLVTQNG